MNNETLFPTAKEAILSFVDSKLNVEANPEFTADQLRFYVNNNTLGGVSPSSADRVLRQLRQSGKLDYCVLNRGRSLYRALPLGTTHGA